MNNGEQDLTLPIVTAVIALAVILLLPFLFRALRRWLIWAGLAGLVLGSIAGWCVWNSYVPQYEASALIKIAAKEPYIAYPSGEQSPRFAANQETLIRSPLVLEVALNRPAPLSENTQQTTSSHNRRQTTFPHNTQELEVRQLPELKNTSDPVSYLEGRITLRQEPDSEYYWISYAGSSPEGAADIVNAVVDEYFNLTTKEDFARINILIRLLENEKHNQSAIVEGLRRDVRDMSKSYMGIDPYAAVPVRLQDPLSDLETQISNARFEHALLRARIADLQEEVFGLRTERPASVGGPVRVFSAGENNDFEVRRNSSKEEFSIFLGRTVARDDQTLAAFADAARALLARLDPRVTIAQAAVEAVNELASGFLLSHVPWNDAAFARFDRRTRALVIDVDLQATTAKTVVDAINKLQMFQAKLIDAEDVGNDGSGLVCRMKTDVPHADSERALQDEQGQAGSSARGTEGQLPEGGGTSEQLR
jgi:hypothetical protein